MCHACRHLPHFFFSSSKTYNRESRDSFVRRRDEAWVRVTSPGEFWFSQVEDTPLSLYNSFSLLFSESELHHSRIQRRCVFVEVRSNSFSFYFPSSPSSFQIPSAIPQGFLSFSSSSFVFFRYSILFDRVAEDATKSEPRGRI